MGIASILLTSSRASRKMPRSPPVAWLIKRLLCMLTKLLRHCPQGEQNNQYSLHPPFKSWSVCNFLKVVQTAARHCIEGVGWGPDCSMMKVDWLKEPACTSKRSNHGEGAQKRRRMGYGEGRVISLFSSHSFSFSLSSLPNSRRFSSLAWTATKRIFILSKGRLRICNSMGNNIKYVLRSGWHYEKQ